MDHFTYTTRMFWGSLLAVFLKQALKWAHGMEVLFLRGSWYSSIYLFNGTVSQVGRSLSSAFVKILLTEHGTPEQLVFFVRSYWSLSDLLRHKLVDKSLNLFENLSWQMYCNQILELMQVHSSQGGGFKYFLIFIPIWGNDPIWLIFFRWAETTN